MKKEQQIITNKLTGEEDSLFSKEFGRLTATGLCSTAEMPELIFNSRNVVQKKARCN
ncbi:MAG: hypothetical protein H7Z13_17465 [Ferruginibacter sp.]|nr:hypothetical protein [Ferruginibacter sp.]